MFVPGPGAVLLEVSLCATFIPGGVGGFPWLFKLPLPEELWLLALELLKSSVRSRSEGPVLPLAGLEGPFAEPRGVGQVDTASRRHEGIATPGGTCLDRSGPDPSGRDGANTTCKKPIRERLEILPIL